MKEFALPKKKFCVVVLFLHFYVSSSNQNVNAQKNFPLENLTPAYSDANAIFYFDSTFIPTKFQLPFAIISDAWKFLRTIYSGTVFRQDPRVYIIMHGQDYNGPSETEITTEFRNVIFHCKQGNETEEQLSDSVSKCTLSSIINQIAEFQGKIINPSDGNTVDLIYDWKVLDIIAYDKVVGSGNEEIADAFKEEVTKRKVKFPQENVALFVDWYLQIYERYGGRNSVSKFLDLVQLELRKGGTSENMVPGKFVHLWNEAVGRDLRELAYKAFGWTPDYRRQFQVAREAIKYSYKDTFPNASSYIPPKHWLLHAEDRDNNVTLVYSDENIAFYVADTVTFPITWAFKLCSDAWGYAKRTYGPFGPDPILYFVLRAGTDDWCHTTRADSYIDKEYEGRIMIDCERTNLEDWNSETSYIFNSLMDETATTILATVKETGNWPATPLVEYAMSALIAYDIHVNGLQKNANALEWMKQQNRNTENSPRKNTFWFRDWFYPIYKKFGGSKIIKAFFEQLYLHWPRKGTDYTRKMQLGEFVHFWSGAANEDLTKTATKAFGWTPEDNDLLVQARREFPQINYTYAQSQGLTQKWKEDWDGHSEELSLVYSDDHVAIYFDDDINQNITWPFKILSDGWRYAKENYGPLSKDPLLYIILHEKLKTCITSKAESYLDKNYENRNVIDCGQPGSGTWTLETTNNTDLLLTQIGYMIMRNARGTGNWPGIKASGWSMTDVLLYDIYKGLKRPFDASRCKDEMLNKTYLFPEENTFWFRDWYYPIYKNYGGPQAFSNFFSIINSNWPQKEYDYTSYYDLGTMVHFWSGAVGENLWNLAAEAFGWSARNHRKYLKARVAHPNINYTNSYLNETVTIAKEKWKEHWKGHAEELTLVHTDAQVAVYFDPQMDFTITWPFKPLSDAWRYTKQTYGPFGPDDLLYVVLHDGIHDGCKTSRTDSSYIDEDYENLTVIDCGKLYDIWTVRNGLDELMHQMGRVVLRGAKKVGNWPAYEVAQMTLAKILVYDIYKGIGMDQKAAEWIQSSIDEEASHPRENTFWFRDWHYPIYAKYGHATVLNNFLTLLSQFWPQRQTRNDYANDLNVGEYVHFWSGAAGISLRHMANETFGWSSKYENQLKKAAATYPLITYKEQYEVPTEDNQPLLIHENKLGHLDVLFKVYVGPYVTVYFDTFVTRSVKWPFSIISKVWNRARATYDTLQSAEDPIVKVFLHSNGHNGCQTYWNLAYKESNENLVDCGVESRTPWSTGSSENIKALVQGFVNLIQQSAKQIGQQGQDAYDRLPFTEFLMFDTHLQLGNYEEAYKLLSDEHNTEIQSGGDRYWIRDWYLPIYTEYGGISVFNNFLSLLSSNWNPNQNNRKMNTGQLVHFWSTAANENLVKSAEQTFGWNQGHRKQFRTARMDYPQFRYSCYDCNINEPEIETSSLIVWVSFGFAFIIIAAVAIPLAIYRRKLNKLQEQIRELTLDEIKEFFEGNPNVDKTDNYVPIESIPFNMNYELPKDRLDVFGDSVLGSGEFGLVVRGLIKGVYGKSEDKVVAIKTVKPNVDVTYFKALLMELKVLGYLGTHENIASLIGSFTVNIKNREVFVAIEFCSNGDLLGFLKRHRQDFDNVLCPGIKMDNLLEGKNSKAKKELSLDIPDSSYENRSVDPSKFSTWDLVNWSKQIANGMNYIASKRVVHGDLAARNVLLTSTNIAKISDFGLSRQLSNYSNYLKTTQTPLPWRWMAIESLREMNFSVQSDVWAYGVTMYEIFSLGMVPYAGWTWDYEFVEKLATGQRFSAPAFANEEIYRLMMDCMKNEPSERLQFAEIGQKLQVIQGGIGSNESYCIIRRA